MKKGLHILFWILALLLLLAAAGIIVIQSPKVQTAIGQEVVSRLEKQLDADVSFSSVTVRPFDALLLEDAVILDRDPYLPGMDTLLRVDKITAKFSLAGALTGNPADIRYIRLHGGLFNLVMEPYKDHPGKSITNLQRTLRMFPSDNSEPMHWGNLLKARSVEVKDVRFRLENPISAEEMALEGSSVPEGVIDWNHLDAMLDYLEVHGLKVADDQVIGTVKQLRLHEDATGFRVHDASAREVRVGNQKVHIRQLHLSDSLSDLRLNDLNFYGPIDDYGEFIEKIRISANLSEETLLDIRTLSHFMPNLGTYSFRGHIGGNVEGTVPRIALNGIRVHDTDHDIRFLTSGTITGLPEVDLTRLDLQVKNLAFRFRGLDGFVEGWAPGTVIPLENIAPDTPFTFNGNVSGLINHLGVKGALSSPLGLAKADVILHNTLEQSDRHPLTIGGTLSTEDLHLGRITGIEELGPVTLSTGLEAALPSGSPELRLDSLKVDRLNLLGYDYKGISAVGNYREDAFDGRITSADPNLNFLFQGVFNLSNSTRNAAYNFFLSLGYADLHALNIDRREQSKISFVTNANFLRTDKHELIGSVSVNDILLVSDTGRHDIGNMTIRANTNDNLHRLRLDSDFLQASFVGDHPVGDFVKDLQRLILERDLNALLREVPPTPFTGGSYDVSLKMANARELLNFLSPGLYVENKTEARLKVSPDGLVKATVRSGRIAINEKYIKDLKLDFDNGANVLSGEITGSSISLAGALLKNNRLRLFADDNHIGLGYIFDNEEDAATRAEVYITGDLQQDKDGIILSARTLPSNIYYNGDGWSLSSGDIICGGGRVSIDKLLARHEDERLLVNGGYAPGQADTLTVTLEKFNLGLLNTFTGGMPSLDGRATGRAVILSSDDPTPGLLAGIVCDSTRVSGKRLGTVRINSVWDDELNRFNATLHNDLNGRTTLQADAYLVPSTQRIHADARLDGLDMGYLESFLNTLFTEFGGRLSGEVSADGTLKDIHLASKDLYVRDGRMTLDFTHVPYRMEGPLDLDDDGIHFQNIRLTDGEGGTGRIQGTIALNGFKDMSMDTHVTMRDMRALALAPGENSIVSGDVYASGKVDITGPVNKLLLNIDASTVKSGDVHIPLQSRSSGQSNELLTFKKEESFLEEDPYEVMMAAGKTTASRARDLRVLMRIRPNNETQVYLDIDNDNSLKASGTGTVEIETQMAQGSFTLNGNYDISQGSFHFSVLNLVSRDFTIQDGSSVRFNGDVWDTDLNVKGLYVTKASLSNLISDDTAIGRRTVNCGIDITGKLSNPEVKFNIDVPDLSPVAQAQVESVLNTDDKIQKQFVYLLVAGNFLPAEESGITTNGTDVLYSNVSSIMSDQLNNIFQKLNIPLDLGLNYQATQTGSNIFDVALSTQLFNNRVIVNGTVGNKQLVGGTTTNEISGDIDIEIKLNRSGSLRLNLFSHSADQFSYYLDNSQRNGAGIAYQREFNSFVDFFRELFVGRATRERRQRESILRPARNVILQIDSTGKSTPYAER